MDRRSAVPRTVDEYILGFPEEVQAVLRKVREVVRSAAPDATEIISYRMPALRQQGVLVYYAAFKTHLGFYPPITGDAALERAAAPFAGEKGNLRFPLSGPIPYDLIRKLTELRSRQDLAKNRASMKRPRCAIPSSSRAAAAPESKS